VGWEKRTGGRGDYWGVMGWSDRVFCLWFPWEIGGKGVRGFVLIWEKNEKEKEKAWWGGIRVQFKRRVARGQKVDGGKGAICFLGRYPRGGEAGHSKRVIGSCSQDGVGVEGCEATSWRGGESRCAKTGELEKRLMSYRRAAASG